MNVSVTSSTSELWNNHINLFFGPLSSKSRRRQRQPTPVLLPGKSHGWRLVGCSPWGHEESDTTKRLHFHFSLSCIGEGNGNPLSVLAWRIPGTGEPGGLPSMGLQSQTRLKRLSSSSSLKKCVCQGCLFNSTVAQNNLGKV